MKLRSLMTAICVLATANIVSAAPFAYVANSGTKNVSVIDTADNLIKATIALPDTLPTVHPDAYGVAVGASGQYVYVGLKETNEVAVIDAATNSVVKRIGLGSDVPGGLAVNDAETRLYVTSVMSNTLIVIDISNGAAEVGRVSLADVTISNPEGVVLASDGTKAYVANATSNGTTQQSGGSVAEIAIDESNNLYTRTSVTPVLAGQFILGLALSSDNSKLYISGSTGTAAVMNTSTKAVTALPVNTGNMSVAITPDDSKVYAPSWAVDKIYVIDAAANPNVVLGTQYSVIGAPQGSSVTPDGSKLYLTMNNADSVKVFNTSTNVVDATITLPAGAKPTSMGKFIGPAFTNTITASDDNTNCSISPEGVIAVNAKGRTFNIVTLSGNCDVTVDGGSVGQPSAYTFSDVTANHTIAATPIAGTFYTVSGDWISNTGVCVESTPVGINCASKSAKFAANSTITLKATTGFAVKNGTWGGACAGQGATCTLTVDADKSFGTTVQFVIASAVGPFFNVTKSSYHGTPVETFPVASANDYIKISNDVTSLTTDGPAGLTVKASNQWLQSDFNTKGSYVPMTLTITNVAIIIQDDNITL